MSEELTKPPEGDNSPALTEVSVEQLEPTRPNAEPESVVVKCERWLAVGAVLYVGATGISLIVAHVAMVIGETHTAELLIAPASRALTFVDTHWRATLIAASPLLLRQASKLVLRLKEAGPSGLKFWRAPTEKKDRKKTKERL